MRVVTSIILSGILAFAVAALPRRAAAEPDPRRKVIVLEHRAGSSALPRIAARVVAALQGRTSLQVLGPDQARVLYGDRLDQALVKCGGDAPCLARIGQRLGAAEVILVGVSELGDVILTMQRIDVAAREISGRVADSLPAAASPTDAQIASYAERLLPPGDFLRFGVIDIITNLAGAAVLVDGAVRGVTPLPALRLRAPATYDLRVEKPGYAPFATRVALPPDGEIKVEAELARRRDRAWYDRWYILAGAGLVVAGAGATALYFGMRDPGGDAKLGITVTVR